MARRTREEPRRSEQGLLEIGSSSVGKPDRPALAGKPDRPVFHRSHDLRRKAPRNANLMFQLLNRGDGERGIELDPTEAHSLPSDDAIRGNAFDAQDQILVDLGKVVASHPGTGRRQINK